MSRTYLVEGTVKEAKTCFTCNECYTVKFTNIIKVVARDMFCSESGDAEALSDVRDEYGDYSDDFCYSELSNLEII
jgi:hypothetical protein